MHLLLSLMFAATAVAVPQSSMKIIGGNTTTIQEYPFMSNMQNSLWGIWWYQSCGGTLITSRAVLSAAHCYYGDDPSSWRVILGSSMSSSGGTTYKVAQLILHEHYDNILMVNDIAIVKLQSGAIMSSRVGRASIAGQNYNLPDGSDVYAVGWGTTTSGGDSSEQLRHVDLKVINQRTCADRYTYLKQQLGYEDWPEITSGMLCAGLLDVGGKDSCQGDSGGPVVHKHNILVAITSWGYGCAHPCYPGVSTRVSLYTNWISSNA